MSTRNILILINRPNVASLTLIGLRNYAPLATALLAVATCRLMRKTLSAFKKLMPMRHIFILIDHLSLNVASPSTVLPAAATCRPMQKILSAFKKLMPMSTRSILVLTWLLLLALRSLSTRSAATNGSFINNPASKYARVLFVARTVLRTGFCC